MCVCIHIHSINSHGYGGWMSHALLSARWRSRKAKEFEGLRTRESGVDSSPSRKAWGPGALRAGENGYFSSTVRQRVNSTFLHRFILWQSSMRASQSAQVVKHKNPSANAGSTGGRHRFNPRLRKIPWRRKWKSTYHSYLENHMDRGAWYRLQSMGS